MKRYFIFALLLSIVLYSFSSCSGLINDYNEYLVTSSLIDTEWSTEDMSEGLKFYKNNQVLFYCQKTYGVFNDAGSYAYDISNDVLTFEGLTINFGTYIVDITNAFILKDGTMKLIWHYVGQSDNYYEILYQRR